MAQNITLLGATYSAVPAVQLPKSGGGTALFTDVTDTTAAAEDVASGKYFYTASGVKTEGTASGGSTTLIRGALRPDAELVQSYTYDKKLHADEGITIPSYTTTSTTLIAAKSLTPTITCDFTTYDYYVLIRMATIPTYSITTVGKGREEYALNGAMYEITRTPANTMHALVDTTKYYTSNANIIYQAGNFVREVYYSSGTAITYYASAAYGYNQTVTAPAMNSGTGSTLTLKSPAFIVRGNATYFVNTYMNAVSDVRYQYVIDVYRAPKANLNLDGWGLTQQWLKMNDDILNNNGKLT